MPTYEHGYHLQSPGSTLYGTKYVHRCRLLISQGANLIFIADPHTHHPLPLEIKQHATAVCYLPQATLVHCLPHLSGCAINIICQACI